MQMSLGNVTVAAWSMPGAKTGDSPTSTFDPGLAPGLYTLTQYCGTGVGVSVPVGVGPAVAAAKLKSALAFDGTTCFNGVATASPQSPPGA